ncbi:hypothetical protein ACSOCI_09210 [Levilactobacillus brevis]|uniref:hypothetical protein n=1 Tax=Levilactobacillus brevis TaxID=1580 RepID=UPI003F61E0C3
MSAPIVKFKRISLNRVILAKQSPDHVTAYWAQYFRDDGNMVFQEKLTLNETAKLVAEEKQMDELANL